MCTLTVQGRTCDTEAAVREFQRAHGLVPDGIVGPRSWAIIDTLSAKV